MALLATDFDNAAKMLGRLVIPTLSTSGWVVDWSASTPSENTGEEKADHTHAERRKGIPVIVAPNEGVL